MGRSRRLGDGDGRRLAVRAQLPLRGLRDGDRGGDEQRAAGGQLRLPARAARHRRRRAAGSSCRPRTSMRSPRALLELIGDPGRAAHARRGGAPPFAGLRRRNGRAGIRRGCWLPSVPLDERVERQTRGLRALGRHRRPARGRIGRRDRRRARDRARRATAARRRCCPGRAARCSSRLPASSPSSASAARRPHPAGVRRRGAATRLGPAAEVRTSASVVDDLREIARAATGREGDALVMYGDIVTHTRRARRPARQPACGDADLRRRAPAAARLPLPGAPRPAGQRRLAVPRRPYAERHVPRRPARRPGRPEALVAAAERLAPLAADPPPPWLQELDRKVARWRNAVGAPEDEGGDDAAGPDEPEELADDLPDEAGEPIVLSDEDEAPRAHPHGRRARGRRRAAAGRARAGERRRHAVYLRRLFWARPLSPDAAGHAAERIRTYDEDRLLLDSAVKSTDGFFTTFFVSPYSKHIARWAARRGLTPNQVTTVSMLIGVLAAAAFATGERWGLIAGAVLLQIASPPTASTASSPATRGSSPSSAPGWTRCSTARRSTSRSPAWRSARATPAIRCGCSPAPRSRCRPCATCRTSRTWPSPTRSITVDAAAAARAAARPRRRSDRGAAPGAAPRARRRPRPGDRSPPACSAPGGSSTGRAALRWVKQMVGVPDRRALRRRSRSPPRCSTPGSTFIVAARVGRRSRRSTR